MGETILILGGARSGKSRIAESLTLEGLPVTYVATAAWVETDPEMTERITRHRKNRPQHWTTLEVTQDLDSVLPGAVRAPGSVVIDCVTLWLTNLMLGTNEAQGLGDEEILATVTRTAQLARGEALTIWVSNETGSGIIPDSALGRRFVDLQGLANQRLAAISDRVILCVAGLPMRLK